MGLSVVDWHLSQHLCVVYYWCSMMYWCLVMYWCCMMSLGVVDWSGVVSLSVMHNWSFVMNWLLEEHLSVVNSVRILRVMNSLAVHVGFLKRSCLSSIVLLWRGSRVNWRSCEVLRLGVRGGLMLHFGVVEHWRLNGLLVSVVVHFSVVDWRVVVLLGVILVAVLVNEGNFVGSSNVGSFVMDLLGHEFLEERLRHFNILNVGVLDFLVMRCSYRCGGLNVLYLRLLDISHLWLGVMRLLNNIAHLRLLNVMGLSHNVLRLSINGRLGVVWLASNVLWGRHIVAIVRLVRILGRGLSRSESGNNKAKSSHPACLSVLIVQIQKLL